MLMAHRLLCRQWGRSCQFVLMSRGCWTHGAHQTRFLSQMSTRVERKAEERLLRTYTRKFLLKVHPDRFVGEPAQHDSNTTAVATFNAVLDYARQFDPPASTAPKFGADSRQKCTVRFFLPSPRRSPSGHFGRNLQRYVNRRICFLLDKTAVNVQEADRETLAQLREQWRLEDAEEERAEEDLGVRGDAQERAQTTKGRRPRQRRRRKRLSPDEQVLRSFRDSDYFLNPQASQLFKSRLRAESGDGQDVVEALIRARAVRFSSDIERWQRSYAIGNLRKLVTRYATELKCDEWVVKPNEMGGDGDPSDGAGSDNVFRVVFSDRFDVTASYLMLPWRLTAGYELFNAVEQYLSLLQAGKRDGKESDEKGPAQSSADNVPWPDL